MEGTKGLHGSLTYCNIHIYRSSVPNAETKGEPGMAWILAGARKSLETVPECTLPQPVPILRELDLTDLSEHVDAKISLITRDHPELFLFNEWPGMEVNAFQINLHNFRQRSWPASQEYRPNLAPAVLHRPALLNFFAHRKRVFTTHHY